MNSSLDRADLPTTAEILREIGSAGVIVGSWPRKGAGKAINPNA